MLTIALMVVLGQAGSPVAGASAVPRDVAAAVATFAAVEKALAVPGGDVVAVGNALVDVSKAEADRLIRESGVRDVDPGDRAALDDLIAELVGDAVRDAWTSDARKRATAVRLLARRASCGDLAALALDRWLGFDARPPNAPQVPGEIPAGMPQLSVTSGATDLRVALDGSRIVAEVGGAGTGNGFVDAGEWVEVALSIQNVGPQPWFSTTAFFRAESACVLVPGGGIETPELPARGGTGELRAWLYLSRECTGAPRRFQLAFRDTHRSPTAEHVVGLSITPLEVAVPRVANHRFDTDDLGSSDGTGRKDVNAERRFEFSCDLTVPSGDPVAMRVRHLVPADLRPLFTSVSYRDEPLLRDDRVFRPGDDLDGHVVNRERFERVLQHADVSARWVTGREDPRLWLALDATLEVPRPGARPAPAAEPPRPPAPVAPLAADVVAAMVRPFLSLAPHPVDPELRNAVSAASGLELLFDSKGFQAAYREALWPTPRKPPQDPCPSNATGTERAADDAGPLRYRHRLYHPLSLAALTPPRIPEPPPPEPQPAPAPKPEPQPVAAREGTAFRVDLGVSYVSYGAEPEARPALWGSESAVELMSFRAQVQVGLRPAALVALAYGIDARIEAPGGGQGHNLIENELGGGVGWTLETSGGVEVVPNVRLLLLHRSLKGVENATTAVFEPGLIVRFVRTVGLAAELGYRLGNGAPRSSGRPGALIDGSGPRVGGALSIAF